MSKSALLKAVGVLPKVPKRVSAIKKAGVEYAIKKGSPGRLMMLDVSSIQVDPTYQRACHRAHAMAIAKNWDWRLVKAVSVSRRPDGSFYCYDGAHTVVGARMRGDIEMIPCYVVDCDGIAEEAQAFIGINRKRIRVGSVEAHNAGVIAGDEIAVAITNILSEYGIKTSATKSGVGVTNAISIIRGQFERLKDFKDSERRLRMTLDVIRSAWPDSPKAYSGNVVRSVWRVVSVVSNKELLTRKAAERLGRYRLEDILFMAQAQAKATGAHLTLALQKVLLEQFNFNAKKERLA